MVNHYDGTYQLDSEVFQWNGQRFSVFHKISTKGAGNFNFFTMNGEDYLAVANHYDGSTHSVKSVIYKWSGGKFNKFQEIATEGAMGCAAFEINNDTFIAFANNSNSQKKRSVQSTVFKWSGGPFVKLQSLQTHGARDVKSVIINGHTFLAFANYYSESSYNIDSFIYKLVGWQRGRWQQVRYVPVNSYSWSLHLASICHQRSNVLGCGQLL